MRPPLSILALLLLPTLATAQQATQANVPTGGFVPDSVTAVRVAVAVWTPMYGERSVMARQPFVAKLNDSVWTVSAKLSGPRGPILVLDGKPFVELHGAPLVAKIARRDARVLEVSADE
jgi:NTF2 fold immunity protein of polymorphic toxin system component